MMFAPILAGVARAVVAGIVFAGFKRLVRSLNRELAEPVRPRRITKARARILTEGEGDWGEPESAHAHQNGARTKSE
jgi:hypothetical protein